MSDYARTICKALCRTVNPQKVTLILEPGASILASSVDYICTVLNRRQVRGTGIITTDGSMLHINPFMAKRVPRADLMCKDQEREQLAQQIVCGATCMENDRLLYLNDEAALQEGDQILFHCAGAYTMSFNGCFIDSPPYVYKTDGDGLTLLRDRRPGSMMIQ